MVKTLTVRSNGTFEINTGLNVLAYSDEFLTPSIDSKIESIVNSISADGASEVHLEKDDFRRFEHLVVAGHVSSFDFGTVISEVEFDALMVEADEAVVAFLAEQEAVKPEDPAPEIIPEDPVPEII